MQVSYPRRACKVRLLAKTFVKMYGFDPEMIEERATQGVLADPLVFQSSYALSGHSTL